MAVSDDKFDDIGDYMKNKYIRKGIAIALAMTMALSLVSFGGGSFSREAEAAMKSGGAKKIASAAETKRDTPLPSLEINKKKYEKPGVQQFFGEYYFSMDIIRNVLDINLEYSLKDEKILIDWQGIVADVSCNPLADLEASTAEEKNPGGFPITSEGVIYLSESFLRDVLKISLTYDSVENLFSMTFVDEKKSDEGKKIAYLTFDDGIDPEVTNLILDVLKEKNAKGTFFLIGKTISWNKGTINRIVDEGHTLGNHSFTHKASILYSSLTNLDAELKKTDEAFYEILGWAPKYFRPPYGITYIRGKEIKEYLEGRYSVELWNVDSRDSLEKDITAEKVFRNIKNGVGYKKNAVILMHTTKNNKTTAEALPMVIDWLREKGYELRSLSER